MRSLRWRLFWVALATVFAVAALVPRNTTQRVLDQKSGRMKDPTVRRVPISLGLALQGGIHLALEVDQARGPVPDAAEAIRRAERVVRTRIDQFGTTEPVVQVVGGNRLIVELPGEKDPDRAKRVIQQTAFLEFRITDMQSKFRDAIPAIDRALRAAGVQAPGTAPVSAVSQLFGADTAKQKQPGAKRKQQPDTAGLNAPGPLSSLLYQGALPGEYLVPVEQVPVAESLLARPEVQRLVPRGIELKWGTEDLSRGARSFQTLYAVEDRPIITGDELEKATARRDQLTNQSVVDFVLSRRGGRTFERETGRHVNDYMAIILDGRVQRQPPVRGARGGGADLLRAADARGPRRLRLHADAAGARRARPVGGHRRGRERADLRAHPRGAAARQADPHGRGRGLQACDERHHRLQREHGAHGGDPLPRRDGPGAGLRDHAHHRHHRLHVHGRLPRAHLLHDLAAAAAGHGHPERLMIRLFANANYDFIKWRRWAIRLTPAFIVPGYALFFVRGLNYSIEFTGGTLIQVTTVQPVGTGKIRSALDAAGVRDAEIQQFGASNEYVIRARLGAGS